ncbi:MAG: ABC transporter ATP-binding protein [Candidatus Desulforudis sp.]|nr:ABC transporter ATP-binding protein [Desulforudis sp.]
MTAKVLVRLDRVTRDFTMGEVVVNALKETTLEIFEGELLVILGPSGSGKSTLLNILGGMDQPSSGEMWFGGRDLSRSGDAELTRYRRNEVGFLFQFYNLISDLTARENVELAANLVEHPLPADQILTEVGLADRMDHFPSQLSGGEQQRVSIARAAVKNPRLLLCDEPTGALDYQTGKLILGLLAKVNQEHGRTVIIVTHNTAIAAMAHRTARMRSGRIVETRVNPAPVAPERIEW